MPDPYCAEYHSTLFFALDKTLVFVRVIHKEVVSDKEAIKKNGEEHILRRPQNIFDMI